MSVLALALGLRTRASGEELIAVFVMQASTVPVCRSRSSAARSSTRHLLLQSWLDNHQRVTAHQLSARVNSLV